MRYTRVVPLLAAFACLALAADAAPGHGNRGRGRRVVLRPAIGFYAGPWWGFGPGWWGPAGYWGPPVQVAGFERAAAVRVQVEPRDAEVYVDGHYAGLVDDFDGTFQRLRLLPGTHTLDLYSEGHRSVRQDVHVGPGHTLKIEYTMQPLAEGETAGPRPAAPEEPAARPATPEDAAPAAASPPPRPPSPALRAADRPAPPGDAGRFGQLLIRTQPRVVEVWVDGERWPADTAGTLTLHLPAGVHRVELRRAGHDAFETEIEVRAGEARELNVRLREDGSSL